jgi:hypothetical protein
MPGIDERDIVLLQRLNAHPVLRARVESLLGAVEDAGGDLENDLATFSWTPGFSSGHPLLKFPG